MEKTVGLRAKKRAATREKIQKSALNLIEKLGYETVTIEMICTEAIISKRTFFNYFKSKESVILEKNLPTLSKTKIEKFCNDENQNIIDSLLDLIISYFKTETMKQLQKIIRTNPKLLAKKFAEFDYLKKDLQKAIQKKLSKDTTLSQKNLEEQSHMILNIGISATNFLLERWLHFDETIDDNQIKKAKALFKKVTQTNQ